MIPADSAGHDEVVYVGSVGGSPQPEILVGGEVQEVLDTQEALLAKAQAYIEKKAQLAQIIGEEEAERYMASKRAEAQKVQKDKPSPAKGKALGEPPAAVASGSQDPASKPTPVMPPKREYFRLGEGRGRSMSNVTPRRPPLQLQMRSRAQAVQPMTVVPPTVHDDAGWWDTLGAFHNRWNGVYFKGYYFPQGGHAPYRADMPADALRIIPARLRPIFQGQQEALKFHVPDAHAASSEWRAVQRTGRAIPPTNLVQATRPSVRPQPAPVQATRPQVPPQMIPFQAKGPPVRAQRPMVGVPQPRPFTMGAVPVRPRPVDSAQQKLEKLQALSPFGPCLHRPCSYCASTGHAASTADAGPISPRRLPGATWNSLAACGP